MTSMISAEEAEKKFRIIDPKIDPEVEALGKKILRREALFTRENYDDTPEARKLLHFIENRLAQPHLGYLAPDQVNEVWGGSTTDALVALGARYGLGMAKGVPTIGASFMQALLDGSRANEAPLPPAESYDWFKAQVLHAGHEWVSAQMQFNVVAIRGYMRGKGAVQNIGDRWDDAIFLCWVDYAGTKNVKGWDASTDPGLYYYSTNPMNPSGCAHLVPGQYKYTKGMHNGHYAFVQASVVTVARTNSANFTDRTQTETGWFGVNNHAGFVWSDSEGVGSSSAGCQVIKGAGWSDWRWTGYYNTLAKETRQWHYYTLLDSRDLRK